MESLIPPTLIDESQVGDSIHVAHKPEPSVCGLGMLFAWRDSWSKLGAIIYVTVAQMLCGIAKDLTKLGKYACVHIYIP